MAYATLTYYKSTYGGKSVDDTETTKWLNRASDTIDMATGGVIDTSTLSTYQNDMLQKACCAQTEYYVVNGDDYNTSGVSSASIGKFSYSNGSTTKTPSLVDRAMQYLELAGLTFRGINRAGAYYV